MDMTESREGASPELSPRELTWQAENLWLSVSSAFDRNRDRQEAEQSPYIGIAEVQTTKYFHYFVALGLGHIEYVRFTLEDNPMVDHLRIKIRGENTHQISYESGHKDELIDQVVPQDANAFAMEQGKRLVRELDQDLHEAGKPRPMILASQ